MVVNRKHQDVNTRFSKTEYTKVMNCISLCYSYTKACLSVCGDNPRASASGVSYVQVDKPGITILYHLISVDLAHHEIFCVKVGKGGI